MFGVGGPITPYRSTLMWDEKWYKFPDKDKLTLHFKNTIKSTYFHDNGTIDAVVRMCANKTIQGVDVAVAVGTQYDCFWGMRNVNQDCANKVVEDAIAPFITEAQSQEQALGRSQPLEK